MGSDVLFFFFFFFALDRMWRSEGIVDNSEDDMGRRLYEGYLHREEACSLHEIICTYRYMFPVFTSPK